MITEDQDFLLDYKRALERLKHRLTFDCQNSHETTDGKKRVQCIKGYSLSGSTGGTMRLIDVERGKVAEVCLACWEFKDGRD